MLHRNMATAGFVLLVLSLLVPACSAGSMDDALLTDARNLNLTVPPTGSAPLGTLESMDEMTGWLNACSRALVAFFNDVMNLLGLGNETYLRDMNAGFAKGMNSSLPAGR